MTPESNEWLCPESKSVLRPESWLCTLQAEIEHIQHLLESSRVRLQKDFESWFETKVTPMLV